MPQYSRGTAPLNGSALVADAIRRRKTEKLPQREHAALASVSIPTIVAFDCGETTLTLPKAFDILRVVGLVAEPHTAGAQEAFVQDAHALASRLAIDPAKTEVRFRALYTGLTGRILRAWANPLSDLMFEGGGARSDEAMLETSVPLEEIETRLAEHLHLLCASLSLRALWRDGSSGRSSGR